MTNALRMSFQELYLPYNITPPRYTRAPKTAQATINPIRNKRESPTSHAGTSVMPTRKNMIIGVKSGINDIAVMNGESGDESPNIEMKKAVIRR